MIWKIKMSIETATNNRPNKKATLPCIKWDCVSCGKVYDEIDDAVSCCENTPYISFQMVTTIMALFVGIILGFVMGRSL
jgi:hypothetical protein